MKIAKNRTAATTIALFLMLTITITPTLMVFPTVSAHTPPWTFPTSSYVTCTPSRIGVGQYTTIVVIVDRYSPTAGGGAGQRWDGFQLNITKPDGTTQRIGPWQCRSDVASDYQVFTPDQVGTYTIVFSWPGETAVAMPGFPSNSPNIGDYYAGSTSAPAYLTVQQEPVTGYQEPPLPTDYWTRPINAMNRDWSTLASNWLKGSWLTNNFQPAGSAPESPHVLWVQPMTPTLAGGLNDAAWPTIPSDVNDYEGPWSAPIIMNGKIYYNSPPVSDWAQYGYYCMDLYTGETIWYKNGTDNGLNNPYTTATDYTLSQSYPGLTQGWLYHYYSVNGAGILAYLIMVSGSTWYILDSNGNFRLKLINVPGGTAVTDQDGSLLRYSYNPATGNLLCWNISQSIPPLSPLGTNQQQWKARFGATIDAVNDTSWTKIGPGFIISPTTNTSVPAEAVLPRSGYTMNVTIQKNLPGSQNTVYSGYDAATFNVLQDDNRVPKMIFGSFIGATGPTLGSSAMADTFSAWAVSIDEHVTAYSPYPQYSPTQNTNLGFGATLLWNKQITVPLPGKNYTWSISNPSYDDQVFILECKQLTQRWGYSLKTGELLWGPTPAEGAFNFYGIGSSMYYGKILSAGYSGTLYAYDAQTGKLLWTYNDTAPAYESPYGDNFPLSIGAVCDGKVYLYSTEHSPTKPLWRPWLICVNITDGTEMWKLKDYNMGMALADGYIVTANEFDNNIYCIGKGPSATTVETPLTGVAPGSTATIKGMVTDQSPSALAYAKKFGLVSGVPAVSDESQQAWMEYLYQQQPKPSDATGVPVTIDAIDPNGNYVHIGDATSDASGTFGYSWEVPNVPGQYRIIVTFKGSNSYGSSDAETFMGVGEAAPTASPTATSQANLATTTDVMTYITAAAIAIIIAIAIVGLLLLRKRP